MSRKIHKPILGRSDGERRSPRISALDACKEENHQRINPLREEQRKLSSTRTCKIMKRKFDHDHDDDDDDDNFTSGSTKLTKQVWKGTDSPTNALHSTDMEYWRSSNCEPQKAKENQNHDDYDAIANGPRKPSIMPAKHVLELVLDTLQRRDTYEVFAEPVDPDEVENYYEIIKEPMDFGTMRAKLHEGMYENLEQFEHDVFLIPENAMHFNSSTTIYFRQARAIHELAKKVFHALKTDPENFILEFSGTRRRSMRKALSDTKDSRFSIAKSGDVSSKGTPHSPSTSTFRRSSKKNIGCSLSARNFLTGSGDGRLSSTEVADRRITYCASLYNEKGYATSTFYNTSSKPLVLMNQEDISYKDSLMSYVKGLGPIAQRVAKRKLLGQHEVYGRIRSEKCEMDANAFRTFRDFAPGSHPFLIKPSNVIDLTDDGKEKTCYDSPTKEKTESGSKPGKEKIESSLSPTTLRTRRGLAKKGGVLTRTNNSTSSIRDENVKPVILALENSHSNVAEFKSRNKKSCIISSSWKKPRPALGSSGETTATATISSSSLAQQQKPPLPLISQFTFDIPFLKARLNQMNALEVGRGGELLKKRASFEKGGVERGAPLNLNCTRRAESIGIVKPFLYNQSSSSLDKLDTNLALQL